MTQPTRELVLSKIRQHFPQENAAQVLKLLDEYGIEKYEINECNRVQLAIIKVSNGNIEALRDWIRVAKADFRDVVGAAEYPNFMKTEFDGGILSIEEMSTDEQKAIEKIDLQQCEQWLQTLTDTDLPAV